MNGYLVMMGGTEFSTEDGRDCLYREDVYFMDITKDQEEMVLKAMTTIADAAENNDGQPWFVQETVEGVAFSVADYDEAMYWKALDMDRARGV